MIPEANPEETKYVEFRKRQNIVKYQTDAVEASFCDYLVRKAKLAETCRLRTTIDQWVKDQQKQYTEHGVAFQTSSLYECYFNYELNTHTYRHVVNKQILMNYHRLLIEK